MRKWMTFLVLCAAIPTVHADDGDIAVSGTSVAAPDARPIVSAAAPAHTVNDSLQLEKALQSLSWPQFRSVVEAIPKLKADVDAYGPLGWQFVEANYAHYGWKKSIDKLDPTQKQQLGELIRLARNNKIKATP